jgi:hypothetical protein
VGRQEALTEMTEVSLNTKKEYALYYHDKGFSVCILHHNPPHLGKIAAIKWGKYQEERADKTQIAAWWDKDPEYNIMLIMGSISKAIALDVDGDVAKKRLEEKLVEMSTNLRVEFQDTMKNKSGGGGYHFVFRIEDDISDIGNKELWTDGGPHSEIKLKANGGYIVGAPSIHDSGNLYEWNGKDPALITRQQLNELIRLLSPVSEQQQQKQQQPMGASIGEGVEGGGCYRRLTIDDMEVLLKLIMPVYTDGTRDMFLFSLTGAMRKEGFPHEDTEKLVEEISKRSPYSNENMEKNLLVVDATYQKPIDDPRAIRGKAGLRGVLVDNYQPKDEKERQSRIDTFTQICQIINYVKPASAGSSSSNDDGGDGDGGGGTPPSEDDDNKKDNNKRSNKTLSTGAGLLRDKTVEDDETMIISYLATQVISRITVKAFLDTQEIIYYDQRRKHYSSGGGKRGESVINAEIEKIVDEIKAPYSVRGSIKSEVVKSIADRNPVNREDVDADPYTINLDNCLLDIFELVQMDQTPDYLTFSKFPIVYDTDAECPRIERFLGEVIIDTHKLREVLKFLGVYPTQKLQVREVAFVTWWRFQR